jgi:alpha-tubulin suppressor-like RCC1 family protein
LILDDEGKVYGFGSNLRGRLGIEEKVDSDFEYPQHITSLVNIKRIECGYWHSLALD